MGRPRIRKKVAGFIVYPIDRQIPPNKYFWVQVAKCLRCESPLMISYGAHQEQDSIDATIEIHEIRCSGLARETIKRVRQQNQAARAERAAQPPKETR